MEGGRHTTRFLTLKTLQKVIVIGLPTGGFSSCYHCLNVKGRSCLSTSTKTERNQQLLDLMQLEPL